MRIFITGGCGFIGSNYILHEMNSSKENACEVLNFDKITYAGNIENLKPLRDKKNYKLVKGDIIDSRLLHDEINKFKPDRIIHFAAESHVDRSIDGPITFVETNVMGTATLLDVAHNYLKNASDDIKKEFKFIHISTDEVYGSLGSKGLFKETTRYNPSSPYSSSKAGSDHLVNAWHKTYGFPSIITNCSNNYGPFQFPEKLIPLIITNCIDRKPLPVYGNGENIRDWLYVEDHCKAISKISKIGVSGETYNIGGNNEIKNIEIVESICRIMDRLKPLNNSKSYSSKIKFVEDRPGHDLRYAIDSTKIKKALNWKPLENFKTGLLKTVEWYLENEIWWRNIHDKTYNQERLGLAYD